MGRRPLTARHVVAGAIASVVMVACASSDDDDTLAPLPIAGATTAPPTVAPDVDGDDPVSASTTPGGLPIPSAAAGVATSTTSANAAPTGDWDGERFDAGTIDNVSTLGAYTVIELDRWSFTGPDGVTRDAGELDAEPLAAWWTVPPFSNENVRTRDFVMATAVEVLTLDPTDRTRACAEPPPANPPIRWTTASLSAVGPTPEGTIAVLTYSPTGQVTRIRLTRGC